MHDTRRFFHYMLPVLLLLTATGMQAAAIYTNDVSAFLSQLKPGYQIETFDSLATNSQVVSPIGFTSGLFTYTAASTSAFFNADIGGGDIVLSTSSPAPITFTFTSGNITAVGGYFWNTDIDFGVIPGAVTLTLNDGTEVSWTSDGPGSFAGFYSTTPIESLTVKPAPGTDQLEVWATVNDLHVGEATVPEPATVAATFGGLLALAIFRRRLIRS